jgi:hypothetical protein
MGRSALAPLARTLVMTAGRAALQRALPLYVGIGIAAAIGFEGNGMRPATLTRQADAHAPFRIALWGVWLLVSTPAARAVLCTPSSFFLRTLPVARARFFGAAVMRALIEDRRAGGKATLLTTNDPAFVDSVEGARYELRDAALRRVA